MEAKTDRIPLYLISVFQNASFEMYTSMDKQKHYACDCFHDFSYNYKVNTIVFNIMVNLEMYRNASACLDHDIK